MIRRLLRAPAVRWLLLTGVATVLALATRAADTAFQAALMRLRGSGPLDSRLVLVDLQRWPRPRSELARAVDALSAAGARAIALDVLLDLVEPSGPRSEPESRALAAAIARSGKVLVPSHIREDTAEFVDPATLFGIAPGSCGFAGFRQLDGVTWKCWLAWKGRPAFSLAAALALEGRTFAQVDTPVGGGLSIDGKSLPVHGEANALWIDYTAHSPAGDQIVPLDEVLARARSDPGLLRELFSEKLALVGRFSRDSTGISREDLFRVPVRSGDSWEMPGALVHTNLVHSLIRREFLRPAPAVAVPFAAGAIVLAAQPILTGCGTATAASLLALVLAAYCLLSWGLFLGFGLVLPATAPLAGLLTAVAAHVAGRLRSVPRVLERQRALQQVRLGRLALLRIESRAPEQGRVRYGFQLSHHDEHLAPASTPTLEYLAFSHHRAAIVEACDQLTRERLENLEKEVEAIGRRIHSELLGPELAPAIDSIDSEFLLLDVDEAELEVPWELARSNGRFLGEELSVGRRLLIPADGARAARPSGAGPLRLLCVANPAAPGMPTLPDAEDEARELAELASRFPGTVRVTTLAGSAASLDAMQRHLREGVDVLHFSGHSQYTRETAGTSGLVFPEGVLNPDNLRSLVGDSPPLLIYLNSCESAKVTQQGSWGMQGRAHLPRAFVQSGVSLFVGSLWQIEDTVARAVALRFYEELFNGLPVGLALSIAKRSVRNEWMTQAAYVLYGDPRATLSSMRGAG